MKDPYELFGSIAKDLLGEDQEIEIGIPYHLPEEKDRNGVPIFPEVLKMICKLAIFHFEKGYIDLDEEWATLGTTQEDMNQLEKLFEENPDMQKYYKVLVALRERLLEKYPNPFCMRRAYLVKIPITPSEADKTIFELKIKKNEPIPGYAKMTQNNSLMVVSYLSVFHNRDLGWKEKTTRKTRKMINGALKEVEEEIETPPLWHRTSLFLKESVGFRFMNEIMPYLRANPETTRVFAYIITKNLQKGVYKGRPSHTINVDDYAFMS